MVFFDVHMIPGILGVALVGGIIGLDRTAAGQFMISQPVVAGPIAGWLLGDAAAGLVIGAVLELIWVLDMPVGTFVPADATICAVSATAIAVLGSSGAARPDIIGFSILLTTAMVPVTMKFDRVVRTLNSRFADRVASAAGAGPDRRLSRAQLGGLTVFFLKSFLSYLIFVPAGLFAAALFAAVPRQVHVAMTLFVKLLPLIGAAMVVRRLSIRVLDRLFLGGIILAAFLTLTLHAPAVIVVPAVAAAGYAGFRYGDRWT